jgi:CRISPR-associated protein Cas5t
MIYLAVELRTVTASFRNPEFQNFHKTLHLPPPTTLIGLAGAALGLSSKIAQEWFDEDDWLFGISGTSEGYAKDLWKYQSDWNKETGWGRSIVLREILFDNHFFMVFGCADENKVRLLQESFWQPKYALTLGTSDALAKVVSVEIIEKTEQSNGLENCLAPGNILDDVQDNISNGMEFSIYSTSEPIAYDLPTRYYYKNDYDVRRVVQRKTLSFIGSPMQLNYSISGVRCKNCFIPVFPIREGDLPSSAGQ